MSRKLNLPTSIPDTSTQLALTYLADSAMPREQEVKNGEPKPSEGEQGVPFLRMVNKTLRYYIRHQGKLFYLEFK